MGKSLEGESEGDQATRVDLEAQRLAKLLSPAKGTSDAAMSSEAGAACPAAAGAGYADVGAGAAAAPRGPSLPSGRQEIRAEPQATGMESR